MQAESIAGKTATTMDLSELTATSPIDGRYGSKTASLRPYFSEFALFKYRVFVEIEWLKWLSAEKRLPEISGLSPASIAALDAINKVSQRASVLFVAAGRDSGEIHTGGHSWHRGHGRAPSCRDSVWRTPTGSRLLRRGLGMM